MLKFVNNMYVLYTHIHNLTRIGKSIKTESRLIVAEGWRLRMGIDEV